MHVGKLLGYLLLSLVDAFLPPVFVLIVGILMVPPEILEGVFVYLLGVAGLSFVGSLIAALICVRRGGKPFPVTRGTKAVADWMITHLWYWHP